MFTRALVYQLHMLVCCGCFIKRTNIKSCVNSKWCEQLWIGTEVDNIL